MGIRRNSILLVDSDMAWASKVQHILRKHGYDASVARRLVGANLRRTRLKLLVIDVRLLPSAESEEFYDVRNDLKKTPFIAVTDTVAWPQALEEIRKSFMLGAVNRLQRPQTPEAMVDVLEGLLRVGQTNQEASQQR